jgi:hypothetical protein
MLATFLREGKVTAVIELSGMNIKTFALIPYKLLNEVDISRIDYDTVIFSESNITVVVK